MTQSAIGFLSAITLRQRLLLVYLIVVFLSAATVGVAVFELEHSHRIMRDLQDWNGIVLRVEKLKARWPQPQDDLSNLKEDLAAEFVFLATSPAAEHDSVVVQRVREALGEVYRRYDQWLGLDPGVRAEQNDLVGTALKQLSMLLEHELFNLNLEADTQEMRTRVLLASVACLTMIHILVIGSLLRRWLLEPLERLNRQVNALGRDEPPPDQLLRSPQELASLATALEGARLSLQNLRQQLLDGERLTTIGQMAAQLGHNLRNPLASIRAVAQIAGRTSPPPDILQQRMSEIINGVDRLSGWVAGLMEVARRDPSLTLEQDVVPTVQRAAQALAAELTAKEIRLEVCLPAQGLICAHEPTTLEHALIAMLMNAVEASPLGSTIRVEAGYAGHGDALCRIAVSDQGTGLPAEMPERIFEFSYSTKQKGLGLGLALARQALQRQGGSTSAFNNPDGGATVFVELPVHRDMRHNVTASTKGPDGQNGKA